MATNPPEPPTPPSTTPLPPRQQWRSYDWYGGTGTWFGRGWFWGAALVVLGIYFLLSNLGLLWWLRGDVFWPIVLILFGVFLIARRGRWRP